MTLEYIDLKLIYMCSFLASNSCPRLYNHGLKKFANSLNTCFFFVGEEELGTIILLIVFQFGFVEMFTDVDLDIYVFILI